MKKIFITILILSVFMTSLSAFELFTLKSGEIISGELVFKNKERVVILIYEVRFEFKTVDLVSVGFQNSQSEFEILLDDSTLLKGSIVDQDEETYTIGTSLGLSPVAISSIIEIRNAKLIQFKELKKDYELMFRFGATPYGDFILNDLSQYYIGAGAKLYLESNLLTDVWFGLESGCLALIPLTAGSSDYLLLIPSYFTIAYEKAFIKASKTPVFWERVSWHIKYGMGVAPVILMDLTSGTTSGPSMTMASKLEYGFKLRLFDHFKLGLCGNTSIILEKSDYVLMQSCGILFEFQ